MSFTAVCLEIKYLCISLLKSDPCKDLLESGMTIECPEGKSTA